MAAEADDGGSAMETLLSEKDEDSSQGACGAPASQEGSSGGSSEQDFQFGDMPMDVKKQMIERYFITMNAEGPGKVRGGTG